MRWMRLYDMITYDGRELNSLTQDASSSSTACAHTNCSSVLGPVDHLFLRLVASAAEILFNIVWSLFNFNFQQRCSQGDSFGFVSFSSYPHQPAPHTPHLPSPISPQNFQVLLHVFLAEKQIRVSGGNEVHEM